MHWCDGVCLTAVLCMLAVCVIASHIQPHPHPGIKKPQEKLMKTLCSDLKRTKRISTENPPPPHPPLQMHGVHW